MQRPKRRKRWYIPGIISLIFLPVVYLHFAGKEIRRLTIWAIPIAWADTAYFSRYNSEFSQYKGSFPAKRNYTEILLTGDEQHDQAILDDAQCRMRDMLKAGDIVNGLHFIFSKTATYGSFVNTVDRLRVEGAQTYMPFENNLWFYHFQPDTTREQSRCGCFLCGDVIVMEPKITFWERTVKAINLAWSTSWQLIMGYCLFVISIGVLRRKRMAVDRTLKIDSL